MAIAFSNLGASANPDINSGANSTGYTNTSWIPPTDELIVVWVQSRRGGGPDTPTISGNSLTWTQIGTTFDLDADGNGLSLFLAKAAGSSSGATTVDFGGLTQVHCIAQFSRVTGADLSVTTTGIIIQRPTAPATPPQSSTGGSITLAAAADAANRPIACFWHKRNQATTERANWTELDDLAGTGQLRGVESQYRDDAFETTASATWATASNWGGMAAEVKAAVAPVVDQFHPTYADQIFIKDEMIPSDMAPAKRKTD
jgi:hypothetical protein